ncbi:MAG TPA: tetratricopeptide repeat protein [Ktedonobacteraceae bacterium]|nr:tetratricopeptide repeat protein [Ktedonobacteraceae bacterium]
MAKTTFFEYLQNTEDAISSGHIDDAMANCQHILSYFPDALEAQRLLGEIYLAKGQFEEAQKTFDWILVNDPENVIVYCDRALTSERLTDIDTALDCYQQAYELSRGNSQIRQKFNQLSTKVGQQEFMFSRAGLARLYLRGDLLTQAEQEWEAVLNASPERLDARTGLLETCWREGAYDKVEQLATEILEEIPTCLKALIFLAHVTSTFNLERARELLQRAETLDPEMVMAQELFSDLIASQPTNPFISMLKKEAIVFNELSGELEVSSKQTAITAIPTSNGSQILTEAETHVYDSVNLETWKELETNQSDVNDNMPAEALPAFTVQPDIPNVQPSSTMTNNGHTSQSETNLDQIKSSHTFEDDFDPALLEKQPWFQAEHLQPTFSEQETAFALPDNIESTESLHSWSSETREEDFPSPPAWLDVLTKFDSQSDNPISAPSSHSQEFEASNEIRTSSQAQAEPELVAPSEGDLPQEPTLFFTTEESDSEMEWPEWLKSLGAETLEVNPEPEPATTAVDREPGQSFEFQSWTEQLDHTFSEAEQEQMASLEQLDNDLLSQGFVPLPPGTLNSFVEEPSLSSALAELGNFSADPFAPEPPPPQVTSETLLQTAESSEPASPPAIQVDNIQQSEVVTPWENTIQQNAELSPDSSEQQSPTENNSIPLETPIQNPIAKEAVSQTSLPVDNSPEKAVQETPLYPAYRADAFIEDDLETTMKRPAIRLQSMQQSALHPSTLSMPGKGLVGDQGRAQNDKVTHKERLLRGYQFQLAGAYDDAMSEYRIIIRNAPELLSEVISNVRALLKLSPRYSAGFRVLGDAYMRQGEYLQAMEAYNKALTIAKKAKIQSI